MFASAVTVVLAVNIALVAAMPTPNSYNARHHDGERLTPLPQDTPGSAFSGTGGQAPGGAITNSAPNEHWVEVLSSTSPFL